MTTTETRHGWLLAGATKDRQSVTADWQPVGRTLIEGVVVRESRSVPKRNGLVTELYRDDWFAGEPVVGQVFVVRLRQGGISAWHAHAHALDRLTVIDGAVTLVLFDARPDSPTCGLVNELQLAFERPATVIVPPQVWHGIQNTSPATAIIANMPDRAYQYADPDHWRIPPDSPEVPYRFARVGGLGEAI